MGGRGTFASGNNVAYSYKTVDKIDGVKVLQPIEEGKSWKLPEEAHSSQNYIVLDKEGVFRQYREYNEKHEVVLEIGYHNEPALGKGKVLHIHEYKTPGVDNHKSSIKRLLTQDEKKKYMKYFKGVKL